MAGKLTITQLKQMAERNEKVRVYAGGEVRTVTAKHLLDLKRSAKK